MDFSTLVQNRYSVRSYQNKPVEEEKVKVILEAGRLAPSAVNYQPWYFIVIRSEEERERLNRLYHRDWFRTAPAVIVVCADHSVSWKRSRDGKDFADIDAAIAIDHMTLQAADLGLGTCWVCNFNTGECIKQLGLPEHVEPIALLPLGYPDDTPPVKKRKPMNEVVFYNHFGRSQ
jgi:nitroreductase